MKDYKGNIVKIKGKKIVRGNTKKRKLNKLVIKHLRSMLPTWRRNPSPNRRLFLALTPPSWRTAIYPFDYFACIVCSAVCLFTCLPANSLDKSCELLTADETFKSRFAGRRARWNEWARTVIVRITRRTAPL